MESTREGTGVMHRIEELLRERRSSGELIEMGYAPGTVYKVQRRVRQGKNSIQSTGDSFDPPSDLEFSENIIETLLDEVRKYETEIASLKLEVSRLVQVDGENKDLISVTGRQLNLVKKDNETKISNLNHDLDDAQDRLLQEKADNDELKRYFRSKNCGWAHEFEQWKTSQQRHLPTCSSFH